MKTTRKKKAIINCNSVKLETKYDHAHTHTHRFGYEALVRQNDYTHIFGEVTGRMNHPEQRQGMKKRKKEKKREIAR